MDNFCRVMFWGFFSASLTLVSHAAAFKSISISIKTNDGRVLRGSYSPPAQNKPVVILLHGLGAAATEWIPLEEKLLGEKWGWLAYDARGHGQSSKKNAADGTPLEYKSFSRTGAGSEWNKMIDDVGAAVRFLKKDQKLAEGTPILLCGASLGANVALNYAGLTNSIQKVILLSPGLEYAGISTLPALQKIKSTPVLAVVSFTDVYAYQSSQVLKQNSPLVDVWTDVKSGHGVQMFDESLLQRLLGWMAKAH